MRKLEVQDVELEILAEEENEHFSDKTFNYEPTVVEGFEEMVEKHGRWGWCHVTVRVSWRGVRGEGYLGGCSYESEEDFRKDDGYFMQVLGDALDDLNANVRVHVLEADEMRSELSLTSDEATKRRQLYKGLCWKSPVECPHCKCDLRDHKNGVPFKRTIGVYSREQDRTTHWKCPDCEGTWDRNDR